MSDYGMGHLNYPPNYGELAPGQEVKASDTEFITQTMLKQAIIQSLDKAMREEVASSMAEHVLNFFGYSDRIIDNVLDPEDRDAFYMLEDAGLMATEREETSLYDGREWRIHYWVFNKKRIRELANENYSKQEDKNEYDETYNSIPEDIWSSR